MILSSCYNSEKLINPVVNLIILGSPGAGKGSVAKELADRYAISHLSTGEMLREAINSGSTLGKNVEKIIQAGALVDNATMTEVIQNKLTKNGKGRFLLDGFPRTLEQAKALDSFSTIDRAVYLKISVETAVKRLAGRLLCPVCGRDFNIYFYPPKKEGRCDTCDATLIQREDDKENSIRRRLKIFSDTNEPLIEYYLKKSILIEVGGEGHKQEVQKKVRAALHL